MVLAGRRIRNQHQRYNFCNPSAVVQIICHVDGSKVGETDRATIGKYMAGH